MLRCAFCGSEMAYVHGHGACVRAECPMRGVNQAECCSGEHGCVPTSAIARAPAPPTPGAHAVGTGAPPARSTPVSAPGSAPAPVDVRGSVSR